MLFEEAKMCAFQMKQETYKNHCKDNNCQLKHSKTWASVNSCFLLINIHAYSKIELLHLNRHSRTIIIYWHSPTQTHWYLRQSLAHTSFKHTPVKWWQQQVQEPPRAQNSAPSPLPAEIGGWWTKLSEDWTSSTSCALTPGLAWGTVRHTFQSWSLRQQHCSRRFGSPTKAPGREAAKCRGGMRPSTWGSI